MRTRGGLLVVAGEGTHEAGDGAHGNPLVKGLVESGCLSYLAGGRGRVRSRGADVLDLHFTKMTYSGYSVETD